MGQDAFTAFHFANSGLERIWERSSAIAWPPVGVWVFYPIGWRPRYPQVLPWGGVQCGHL